MLTEKFIPIVHSNIRKKFAKDLLHWNARQNKRQMPWKGEKDPYKIWLSEIILQQTRVEQGLKYYERFIEAFPTIEDLAGASEKAVFKLWEGLGYYSRCKNLMITAQFIANEKGGVFPNQYEAIRALKGIGPYTASAIASFAYNQPYAVLDGNVFRVLSRILAIEIPIDTTQGQNLFAAIAQELLPPQKAGAYNQAIMDFGATVCKPVPICSVCFFNQYCSAFLQHKQAALPVKQKKIKIKERWFHYIVLRYKNAIAIQKRTEKDIWQSLFEPILLEGNKKFSAKQILLHLEKEYGIQKEDFEVLLSPPAQLQKLSHQTIHFNFLHLQLKKKPAVKNYIWVSKTALQQYPFPKTLLDILTKMLY